MEEVFEWLTRALVIATVVIGVALITPLVIDIVLDCWVYLFRKWG